MFNKPSKQKYFIKNNLSAISLGWELAIPIFGGAFLGYKIDQTLDLSPIFTLTLVFTGIFLGYYNLYKHIEIEVLRKKVSEQSARRGEFKE
jgi:F0F1-type ATP synthase assembly protein I